MAYGSPRQQSGISPDRLVQKPRFSSQLPLPLLRDIFNRGYFNKAHVFADFIGDNFFALIKDHFILLKTGYCREYRSIQLTARTLSPGKPITFLACLNHAIAHLQSLPHRPRRLTAQPAGNTQCKALCSIQPSSVPLPIPPLPTINFTPVLAINSFSNFSMRILVVGPTETISKFIFRTFNRAHNGPGM
ncbi:Uncharacterised protein [Klebsiella pneumoniae]|uniref:Uncharacterized protein n=1 Tax=Klebsiella pneumoniae TaxID=573 RepID=A0A2X3ELD0_KLEPN|nr:Uncharacterised protein [Klebsiella pneumoniae]